MALAVSNFWEAHGSGGSYSDTAPSINAATTVLVFTLLFASTSSTTAPSSIVVTWDTGGTPVTGTQFGSTVVANSGSSCAAGAVFYVLAPATGEAKNYSIAWSGPNQMYFSVKGYTGGDTSTPLANLSVNSDSATSISVTQSPSAPAGDLIQSGMVTASGGGVSTSSDDNGGSEDFKDNGGATGAFGRSSGSGGTTFTYNASGGANNLIAVSVDVRAPSAAGGSTSTGMGLLTVGIGR